MRCAAASSAGATAWCATMHKAIRVPASEDLRPLVDLLRSRGIPHHTTEESGDLVVWAPNEHYATVINAAYQAWRNGDLDPANLMDDTGPFVRPSLAPSRGLLQNIWAAAWLAPVTAFLVAACIVVASISQLGTDLSAVRYLFFPAGPTTGVMELLASLDSAGMWLRTLTPALLHFGAIHLVFNMLWFWYFGRMMEPALGAGRYAFVILLTAFGGNVLQYLWEGSNNFGGMSGVVYGQIGFIWIWQTMTGDQRLRLPTAMIMVFLAALLIMEILASAFIATAAHVGGLVAGMLAGAALAMWHRGANQRGEW